MRMRAIAAVVTALVLSATTAFAGPNGSIDLLSYTVDPNGNVVPGTALACQGTWYPIFGGFGRKMVIGIFARLNGATAAGISGAELYLDGLESTQRPAGTTITTVWPITSTQPICSDPVQRVNSICTPTGSIQPQGGAALYEPIVSQGTTFRVINTTWVDAGGYDSPGCQHGSLVELGRVEIQQLPAGANFANDFYLTVKAGNPAGNPNFQCPVLVLCDSPIFSLACVTGGQYIINPTARSCNVAVESTTWSTVKDLYR